MTGAAVASSLVYALVLAAGITVFVHTSGLGVRSLCPRLADLRLLALPLSSRRARA
jgi:hypothetical protein